MMVGATGTELVVAAGAVVLGIVGLGGVFPAYLAAVAVILVGAGLAMEGAGIAARYRKILAEELHSAAGATATGTTTIQSLAGIGGIILGILALMGYTPLTLLAVAVLAYGGALVLGSPEATALDAIADDARYLPRQAARVSHRAAQATAMASAVAGGAIGVLGILVLAGTGALAAITVAMIVAGSATLVRGGVFTAREGTLLRHLHQN